MNLVEHDKIWLAVPTFNNNYTVRNVVEKCLQVLQNVIVVDDGSDSCDVEKLLAGLPIQLLKNLYNMGKGSAILKASQFAATKGGKYLITIDADDQHDPKDTVLFFPFLNESIDNIVIGNRNFNTPNVPISSIFGRKFSNFWVHLETGNTIPDTQSGFRAYPIECLNKLKLNHKTYDFEIEALVKLLWSGIRADNVLISVKYFPSHERVSHFKPIKDNLRLTYLHTKLILMRLFSKPKINFTKEFKNPFKIIKLILKENISPVGLASASFVGIALGTLPLISCHSIAIIYVCMRLHLNIPTALTMQNFCFPPFVPLMCIYLGHYLLTGKLFIDFSLNEILSWHILFEWLLGSIILAPILGMIGFICVYFIAIFINKWFK